VSERYIWVIPDNQSRWIWKYFAIHLARKMGMRPVLIVASQEDHKFYAKQGDSLFPGEIILRDDYYGHLVKRHVDKVMEPEVVFRLARDYEERYQISLMRSMLLADRHLGRGFVPGAAGYPRSSISDSANIVNSLTACLHSIKFWEQLAEIHPPSLVISNGGGGGLAGKPYALLCRELGIPMRILFSSRFGNSYFWGHDEFGGFPELEKLLESFPLPTNSEIESVRRELKPNGLASDIFHTQRIAQNLSWPRIIYLVARVPIQQFYWMMRGYRKARIGAKLFAKMYNCVIARLNWNELNRSALKNLTELDTRRVVYFPLQQQPEASTLTLAPYATNQVALLNELALSLPADVQLVVKEHIYALHGRPKGFYENIKAIPNVTLMHPAVSSLELIRRADLVCVITSSAGYEAAVLGKPVVHFGHYSTLFGLKHVWHFDSAKRMDDIRTILRDVALPGMEKKRALEGARYYLATQSLCIDLEAAKIHGREELISYEECEILSNSLLNSLPTEFSASFKIDLDFNYEKVITEPYNE